MTRTLLLLLLTLCLPSLAQYDVIPRPSSVRLDASGRLLTLTAATAVDERLTADVSHPEGWRLTVDRRGILLEASTDAGLFYGRQALRQVLADSVAQLPYAVVEAAPRFAYRGMHLDVCRHFFPKEVVMRYLDIMALHGMNTLHWHLSDDQGWRVEIKRWPRLTEVGAWRSRTVIGRNMGLYDRTPHGGFYTQDDIREVVEYARRRHITIVPEIDMPGHMVAALAAYPGLGCTGGPYEVWPDWGVSHDILCAGNDSVYQFLSDVVEELVGLFPSPIIHMGGDEAPKERWRQCPKCRQRIADLHLSAADGHTAEDALQGYMVRRMEQLLARHGRRLMGWDEVMDCDVPRETLIMNWRDWQGADDPVGRGFDVVRTPNSTLYFDHYQLPPDNWSSTLLFGGSAPLRKVYDYEPAPPTLSDAERARVIGVQANLWTEYIAFPELLEYQALPRMAALAEVQWTPPELKDYDDFLQRLARLRRLYDAEGWHYCKQP